MSPIERLLYPELERFPPDSRSAVLRFARRQPFDWLELAGLGLAVVLVTALTSRFVRQAAAPDALEIAIRSFLVALPLLAVTAGPFLWRRTRRSLREALQRHPPPREASP